MNKEIKKKWLKALLSGEYKQGRGCLHNVKEDCYCCLGVLCEVEGIQSTGKYYGCYTFPNSSGDNDTKSTSDLGDFYRESIGMTQVHFYQLTTMNDTGYSFEAIAGYIEREM